ncbi:MAG: nuclear transport factor 2 family protein, partial [Bacteroidota bacterium]
MKLLFPSRLFVVIAAIVVLNACKDETLPPPCNSIWYSDRDGDGFGDPTNPVRECPQPPGFVADNNDLDDSQSGITTISNETKVIQFMDALSSGEDSVLTYFHPEDFIQHNPFIKDGREGLAEIINGTPTGIDIKIHRIFNENNIYILHSTYGGTWNNGMPQIAFDVFLFDNGSIVEHWDNFTDFVDDGDATTQTNGITGIRDAGDTNSNRLKIRDMLSDVFVEGLDTTYQLYFAEIDDYTQHSVGAIDTASRIQDLLAAAEDGEGIYENIEFVYAEGNFA